MAKKIRKTGFDKRLKAYSDLAKGAKDLESSKSKKLLGLALTAGMACTVPSVADAAIIYSGPQNIFVSVNSTISGFNWAPGFFCATTTGSSSLTMDIQDDSPGDGRLEFSYHDGQPEALGTSSSFGPSTSYGMASILSSGFVIGPAASQQPPYFEDYHAIPDNASGFIGFRFEDCVPMLYGWMRVSQGSADGSSMNIVDWAVETSGAPILAGDIVGAPAVGVPTLNQWGLFALIALLAGAGVRMLRKKEEV